MPDLGTIASGIGMKAVNFIIWGVIGIAVLAAAIITSIILYKRKKWNLKIFIKLPRANGLIMHEKAKGFYDTKSGIIDIKRRGLRAVGMKPFDPKKYLQEGGVLEIMQIGPNDFIPIIPSSYETVESKEEITKIVNGKQVTEVKEVEHVVMKLETTPLARKAWKNYMEREAKNRFTLSGFLEKHWRAIEISIIIFVIFLGFSILWMKLPGK